MEKEFKKKKDRVIVTFDWEPSVDLSEDKDRPTAFVTSVQRPHLKISSSNPPAKDKVSQ